MSALDRLWAQRRGEHGKRLGQILIERGSVTPEAVARALDASADIPARVGETLVAAGEATPEQIAAALAAQSGLRHVDLTADPGEADLVDPTHFDRYARDRTFPWRRENGVLTLVSADPAALRSGSAGQAGAIASGRAIEDAIKTRLRERWAETATAVLPAADSARGGPAVWQRFALFALTAGLVAGLVAAPLTTFAAIVLALSVLISATAALRIAVLGTALRRGARALGPPELQVDRPHTPPTITLLAPLYRETGAVRGLIGALEALDYPKELLDVKLLVEPEDAETRAALDALEPPPWIEIFETPPGGPRTKPRALNAALPFARGEILGIYDVEDRPEPDQLRKIARAFRNAPREIACVQCRLTWRNTRENWLSRCFAIEYAIWFDLLLAGLRDLRLPIPLGGASVFFRTEALREVGGWDAHNVTEDADLGIRLARRGYRAELVDSTTYEEAVVGAWPWIRQRSRWVKGYMQTWLVHMRRPGRAARELGLWGFTGFQVLFLGAILTYLAQPIFWGALGWRIFAGDGAWLPDLPLWLVAPVVSALLIGQVAMFATALLALWRRGMRWLWPWVFTLPVYWPLGALAAYKALWEMLVRPFYWDKTEHGVSKIPDRR